jgi:hypothetical protein
MAQRRPIQLLAVQTPLRHQLIHVFPEPMSVMTFQQVSHLMYKDVLEACRRLLGHLQVKPDSAAALLQVPQRVFIVLIPLSATCTPMTGSHLFIKFFLQTAMQEGPDGV